MPWLAVSFGNELINELNTKYNVSGIPYLVVLNYGKVVKKKMQMRKKICNEINENFMYITNVSFMPVKLQYKQH